MKNVRESLSERCVSFDEIGNRTQVRTPAGNFDYQYDDNNQLTSATNPEADGSFASENFNYDSIGNRTSCGVP